MCEYSHAMGNSCGGLEDYWKAIRATLGLQGGFVWDWVDQALVQRLPDGTERLAYGGDFGDEPNDGPFCLNGVMASDRTPHPSLLELAAVVAPVRIEPLGSDGRRFAVTNEHSFVDLSWLGCTWEVELDGRVVDGGDLGVVDAPPGATVELDVPVARVDPGGDGRVTVTLSFATIEDRPWADRGHVVARTQVEVAVGAGLPSAPGGGSVGSRSGRGRLDDLEPVLALWRAPIDNETFGPLVGERHADRWDRLGLRGHNGPAHLITEVDDRDDGTHVTHTVVVPDELEDIPRVGVRLRLDAPVSRVEWLGDGPHECYPDRRASARFGRWSVAVDDWAVPYVHPQASGNRTGVGWVRFLDESDRPVLVIDRLDGRHVTVSRWTDEEVADAAHLEDLPARPGCYVWLDAAHRGVGSASVGPDVAPEHRVGAGPHVWSYRLR
jgi:beta-galactosidase